MNQRPGKTTGRSQRGAMLAETTASTALIYAFVIILLYVVIESCLYYFIMNGLNQAAREGAREMSMLYIKSGGSVTPDSTSINNVFTKIQVPGVVNSSSQFVAYWPSTYVKNSHPQQMVTVVVTAAPGQVSDEGASKNMSLPTAVISLWAAKFSLVGISMKGSASYPLKP